MKKVKLILLVFTLVFASCTKEKIQKELPKPIYVGCKTNYIDYLPDSSFLMPVLSNKIYLLDLDQDSQNDSRIECENYHVSYGPHTYDEYNIDIEGINNVQFVVSYNKKIVNGSFINENLPYSSSLKIHKSGPGGISPYAIEEGFIGFRKFINGSYFYGWMKVKLGFSNNLIIYDLAISTCENASIKVGYHR